MTDSEAGQIVLEGNYWILCGSCLGSGWHDEDNQEGACVGCSGAGYHLKPHVREALAHLSMSCPKGKPQSGFETNEEIKEALHMMRTSGVTIDDHFEVDDQIPRHWGPVKVDE